MSENGTPVSSVFSVVPYSDVPYSDIHCTEFEALLSRDLKRRFLRFSFLLIDVFGLRERDEQLLRKGSMGMSVSMTDNNACSNLFQ